jgi:hypothetical protein
MSGLIADQTNDSGLLVGTYSILLVTCGGHRVFAGCWLL